MHSSRSKAYSEPESKPLFPVKQRPESSHDHVQTIAEPVSLNTEAIVALSKVLEIDLESPLNIQWVVRDCLLKLEEDNWIVEVVDKGGEPVMFLRHRNTGEKRNTNDIVAVYKELGVRIKYDLAQLEISRESVIFRIQELVYPGLLSGDLSHACSVVDGILDLLRIDKECEFFLVPVVKNQLEDSFFQVANSGGPHMITVNTCINVEELLIRISLERVRVFKSISELLYCVNCADSLADGICAACADCLCSKCHFALHKRGSRMDHLFVFFPQSVCAECRLHSAAVYCCDCCDLFCANCFPKVHPAIHRVQFPAPPMCAHCRLCEARFVCRECNEVYCEECLKVIHQRRKFHHTLKSLRSVGKNSSFANKFETILGLQDRFVCENLLLGAKRLAQTRFCSQTSWADFLRVVCVCWCVYIYACASLCVLQFTDGHLFCVCVSGREPLCVCVCICVCVLYCTTRHLLFYVRVMCIKGPISIFLPVHLRACLVEKSGIV